MDLNIFIVLLSTLFAAGHSLKCYWCSSVMGSCVSEVEMSCLTGDNVCSSQTTVESTGDTLNRVQIKSCTEPKTCVNGSLNLGFSRTAITTQCCNTDLCNSRDASDSSSTNPNGKQCYYCNKDGCFNKVSCAGTEDHCVKAKANLQSVTVTVNGCVSKSMCDALSQVPQGLMDVSCCQGNLCNSAKSITQSLLLLSWPFISYITFH